MYAGKDFDPAERDESELFAFDFSTELAAGAVITAAAWTCTALNGIDGAPGNRLVGPPIVQGMLVQQRVAGAMPGERYILHCEVTTSAGDVAALWSHLPGIAAS